MKEIILNNCRSYIKAWFFKGLDFHSWNLVFINGKIWIENKEIQERIRVWEPRKWINACRETVRDYLGAKIDLIEIRKLAEERIRLSTRPRKFAHQAPAIRIPYLSPYFMSISELRRSGALGFDTGRGTY